MNTEELTDKQLNKLLLFLEEDENDLTSYHLDWKTIHKYYYDELDYEEMTKVTNLIEKNEIAKKSYNSFVAFRKNLAEQRSNEIKKNESIFSQREIEKIFGPYKPLTDWFWKILTPFSNDSGQPTWAFDDDDLESDEIDELGSVKYKSSGDNKFLNAYFEDNKAFQEFLLGKTIRIKTVNGEIFEGSGKRTKSLPSKPIQVTINIESLLNQEIEDVEIV